MYLHVMSSFNGQLFITWVKCLAQVNHSCNTGIIQGLSLQVLMIFWSSKLGHHIEYSKFNKKKSQAPRGEFWEGSLSL